MNTLSNVLSVEALKLIQSIMQQKLAAVAAHQKASNALATFERDVALDSAVLMNPKKEARARKHLRESVKLSAKAFDEVKTLAGMVGGVS